MKQISRLPLAHCQNLGGLSSGGGSAKYASSAITTIRPVPKTKSRHAPSGDMITNLLVWISGILERSS
jgi:hypothetical protein